MQWLLALTLVNLALLQIVTSEPIDRITRRFVGGEARVSNNLEYNVNILAKLNSEYTFPLVIGEDEKVGLWLLTRQTPVTFESGATNPTTVPLYDPRSLPRNATLAEQYACLPSEKSCNQVRIQNIGMDDVGVYTFRFDSSNYLTMQMYTFNVSAYMNDIAIGCSNYSEDSVCVYNASTQTLSVLANEPVNLQCNIQVVQNDIYPIPAQFNFISENFGEECMGNTTVTKVNSNLSTLTSANNKYNTIIKQLSKNCTRTFTKQDISRSYSCQLNPIINNSNPASYEQTKTYESLNIKLDVQYGPDPNTPLNPIPQSSFSLFNKTQMVGDVNVKQKFSCPFIGNPRPLFYWRVVSANTNETTVDSKLRTLRVSDEFMLSDSQELPIPSDLQVGSYVYECKAMVKGLIGKYSQVVTFNLKIIPQPPLPERKVQFNSDSQYMKSTNGDVNVGAIVGGIIGGIALLAIVAIAVIAVIRIRRNNNPKEIEKAKELDIDLTDHNNEINNRKAQLVQQQQQAQVKQQLGNKVIAGLMPNPAAQAYASIAHAAAASAQNRNNAGGYQNTDQLNQSSSTNMGSSNNLINTSSGGNGANNMPNNSNLLTQNNSLHTKSQTSYNNPGFFESASYSNQQNPLESPPPYDAALHQPLKKDSPPLQQHLQHQQRLNQQKDYMGSNTRLISASNTPQQLQRPISHTSQSYTINTNQPQNLSLHNSTPIGSSLQHLQYQNQQQQQANLQYTTVHNMENRARSRNPMNGGPGDMEHQYTTMAAQLSSNPIDV